MPEGDRVRQFSQGVEPLPGFGLLVVQQVSLVARHVIILLARSVESATRSHPVSSQGMTR